MTAPSEVAQAAVAEVMKTYGETWVFDRVSFTVRPGERVGVVGDNGSGKSTLMRLLAGAEEPDNGSVTVQAPGGVGHLAQTMEPPDGARVRDAVDAALADLRALERRMREAEAALAGTGSAGMAAYARLTEEFEVRDGYGADGRVDTALSALGLPGLDRDRRLGTLSGGQRSRLALAAVLAADPELLLLDEPTNDLDDQAVAWLEERLVRHRGTVVAVTHDRVFLDRVTTAVLEVDQDRHTVRRYGDGYAGYLAAKQQERARWALEYEQWTEEVARQRKIVSANALRVDGIPRKQEKAAFGHGAFKMRSSAHGAMGRIRVAQGKLERLKGDPVPPPPEPLRFTARITAPDGAEAMTAEAPEPLAEIRGLRVEGRLSLDSLRLMPGERLLVTGPNGSGKTTLMRVIAGELPIDAGAVRVGGSVGHLRQQGEEADQRTVLQAFAAGLPGHADEHESELFGLGLFHRADLSRRITELSVGQRRRLELARLVTREVDLLLLDEPTNHLSPSLVEEVQEALRDYRGALVVTTHDRRLREAFGDTELALGGTVAALTRARRV